MTTSPTATSLRHQRCLKWLGVLALVGMVLAAIAWQTRERLLAGIINLWVVNDPIERAEVVVVLGGGAQYRAFAAARLFREGKAARVLYPDVRISAEEAGHAISADTELIAEVLNREGVPAAARERYGRAVSSTREEILALREWATRNQVRTIIVPTDAFHSRRLSRLTRQVFRESETRLLVMVVDMPGFRWQEWWRHEFGVITFHNELVKSMVYALRKS